MPEEPETPKDFSQLALGVLFGIAFLLSLRMLLIDAEGRTSATTVVAMMAGALIIVAILPRVAEFQFGPGGVSGKIRDLFKKTEEQKKTIDHQQDIINKLVIYSIATQPYKILWHITKEIEYIYYDNPNERRWAFVALDRGLIQPRQDGGWLEFSNRMNGQNLSAIAKATPAGHLLVEQRGKWN